MSSRKTRVCAAANCSGTEHVYSWPRDPARSRKWTSFVLTKVANFTKTTNSVICFRHFTDDCFSNLQYYKSTPSVKRLLLEPTAVPTIHLPAHHSILTPRKRQPEPLGAKEKRRVLRELLTDTPTPSTSRPNEAEKPAAEPACTSPPAGGNDVPDIAPLALLLDKATSADLAETRPAAHPATPQHPEPNLPVDGHSASASSASVCDERSDDGHCFGPQHERHEYSDDDDDSDSWVPETDDEAEFQQEEDMSQSFYSVKRGRWFDEPKIIVEQCKLLDLLSNCPSCAQQCAVKVQNRKAAYIKYKRTCLSCQHDSTWESSSMDNSIPVINILLSFVILFSGSLPTKFLSALNFMRMMVPTVATFKRYQHTYLHGVMRSVYRRNMDDVHAYLRGEALDLNGDARFDSPGHCAMYGTYTMMDSDSRLIVASQLVKSSETTSSVAMELEGLIRCRADLDDKGYSVRSLTTDRHIQVTPYMRDSWADVKHQFDCWHIAKGLRKKLISLSAKKAANSLLKLWVPAIIDHLYYVVENSSGNHRVEWWKTVVDHCCNIHTHDSSEVPVCKHGPLSDYRVEADGTMSKRVWLNPYNPMVEAMRTILLNPRILNAIEMTGVCSTSCLESFHAQVNRNAPKMTAFSYSGMMTRLQLTVVHHNENCQRDYRKKADGTLWSSKRKSKSSNFEERVAHTRQKASFGYIDDLFRELEKHLLAGTTPELDDVAPPPISSIRK